MENIDATKHLFRLYVSKINPQNYINNILFMDFMATNNSLQVNWQDRPQPKDASYVSKGVPLELMIDLANRLNTKPWFCLPHQANNDTIKQFASTVKASLKPQLRAWVKYSNEVWNGGFEQNAYAAK